VIYFLVPLAIGVTVFLIAELVFRRSGAVAERGRSKGR
jgi:hypothetical protein